MNNKQRIIFTLALTFAMGGIAAYHTIEGSDPDIQRRVNYAAHPVASIAGSVTPSVLLAPLVYWMTGRTWRRKQVKSGTEGSEEPILACHNCGLTYKLSDYRLDTGSIYCSRCKEELPRMDAGKTNDSQVEKHTEPPAGASLK